MKNAIILHGNPGKKLSYDPSFPSASNYYWLPWLQKQLTINEVPTETPEVPYMWKLDYSQWQRTLDRFLVDKNTILVGHSCGAGFFIRWLSENGAAKVGKIYLVAPWLDASHPDSLDFFDFDIDPDLADRTGGITIINSDDDYETIQKSVKNIREKIKNVQYKELHGYGHFYDDRRMEFPELLAEILS